tara:strand:+ start:3804 stop:4034 length:231 start_codon:yes stop_codon:yes gene_type:complete
MIHCLTGYCPAMSREGGVGMSTLNTWITAHPGTDVVSKKDLGFAKENDRLRREIRLLKQEREILKNATQFLASLKQ